METIARQEGINLLGVDIGGATTDVFSIFDGIFNRTVSANLGMSYSISNVLAEAGLENILRWLPIEIDPQDIRNRIKNKMIRPATVPHTLEELKLEQAIAREALRLAFEQHKQLAVGLKGVQQERSIADAFEQRASGETLIDLWRLDLVVGSGGILSHAPRRIQAMMMMIDAYQPLGITRLAVDSIFMMPHLGVLSTVNEKAAIEVFQKDCLIPLGTCVAPAGTGKQGEECFRYRISSTGGTEVEDSISFGEVRRYPLEGEALLEASPSRGFDLGAGRGKKIEGRIEGGVVGMILDGRGRPLTLAEDQKERLLRISQWAQTVELYPV